MEVWKIAYQRLVYRLLACKWQEIDQAKASQGCSHRKFWVCESPCLGWTTLHALYTIVGALQFIIRLWVTAPKAARAFGIIHPTSSAWWTTTPEQHPSIRMAYASSSMHGREGCWESILRGGAGRTMLRGGTQKRGDLSHLGQTRHAGCDLTSTLGFSKLCRSAHRPRRHVRKTRSLEGEGNTISATGSGSGGGSLSSPDCHHHLDNPFRSRFCWHLSCKSIILQFKATQLVLWSIPFLYCLDACIEAFTKGQLENRSPFLPKPLLVSDTMQAANERAPRVVGGWGHLKPFVNKHDPRRNDLSHVASGFLISYAMCIIRKLLYSVR